MYMPNIPTHTRLVKASAKAPVGFSGIFLEKLEILLVIDW